MLACAVCMHIRRNFFFSDVCIAHGNFKMHQSGDVCFNAELKTVKTL